MLPKDPNILLSLLNTKLRDLYPSLAALCDDLDEDENELTAAMRESGYKYDSGTNRFIKA